ncbi:MAG: hypothetical protein WCW14_01920 [Candidatus Paceibacterota bacterium]
MNKNISRILFADHKRSKQEAREDLARNHRHDLESIVSRNTEMIMLLEKISVRDLDRKVKHREDLTFEEAFCGMCYVLAATNEHFLDILRRMHPHLFNNVLSGDRLLASATAFMQLMATKESLWRLTAEEIAGVVAAAMMDPVITLGMDEVVETCGMGGDKGFGVNGNKKKTINVSTLSSLVIAGSLIPTVKHGSYGNTSAVGSTEAIEHFGAKIGLHSEDEVLAIWSQVGFCYLDAHWCKTVHDLSHLLMMETINHIVGPMTPPISGKTRLYKMMGVNEKVHPSVIAKAYSLLHQMGFQTLGGVAVIAGMSEGVNIEDPNDVLLVKESCSVDELSPYGSVVSLANANGYIGTFMVYPSSFDIELDPYAIMFENRMEVIQRANRMALTGPDTKLIDYLAMNAAMGILVYRHINASDLIVNGHINEIYLRNSFKEAKDCIMSGRAIKKLSDYVVASEGTLVLS